jgi:hypothetical protein
MLLLSLGAGVQSSTLLLMALHGEFDQMPAAAIFADTQNEPPAVYDWLDTLEQISAGRIPICRVSAGDIAANTLQSLDRNGTGHSGQPPFFVRNSASDGTAARDEGGVLWRKCTSDYKLAVIRRETRRLMQAAGEKSVTQWIGISLDEAQRMKDSRVGYITNEYPLVDRRMTRQDCMLWLTRHDYPVPPKSSCIICPYHSNAFWREMKHNDTASFEQAVSFDAKLRTGKLPGVTGDCFLHRSFIPLSQVDFSNAEDRGQTVMFGEECEGICGV